MKAISVAALVAWGLGCGGASTEVDAGVRVDAGDKADAAEVQAPAPAPTCVEESPLAHIEGPVTVAPGQALYLQQRRYLQNDAVLFKEGLQVLIIEEGYAREGFVACLDGLPCVWRATKTATGWTVHHE